MQCTFGMLSYDLSAESIFKQASVLKAERTCGQLLQNLRVTFFRGRIRRGKRQGLLGSPWSELRDAEKGLVFERYTTYWKKRDRYYEYQDRALKNPTRSSSSHSSHLLIELHGCRRTAWHDFKQILRRTGLSRARKQRASNKRKCKLKTSKIIVEFVLCHVVQEALSATRATWFRIMPLHWKLQ